MDSFKKGTDIERDLTWIGADGNPIPPSTLQDYQIKVYSLDNNKEEVLVFSKNEEGEERPIVIIDNGLGKIQIKLDRIWSAAAEASNYFCDVYWWYASATGIDGKDLKVVEEVKLLNLHD